MLPLKAKPVHKFNKSGPIMKNNNPVLQNIYYQKI